MPRSNARLLGVPFSVLPPDGEAGNGCAVLKHRASRSKMKPRRVSRLQKRTCGKREVFVFIIRV